MKTKKNSKVVSWGKKEIPENIRKLVLERIKIVSDDLIILVGSKECTREELMKSVEKGDEIGRRVIKAQMDYLRAMASGKLYQK